ncbi:glycosyltransferase family 4 protein [Rossellomorea sp. GCM10028870]|uniref:glycosyltransferase family 4 protein n=1 Tax=Rossellomorea sp. GCM10028870 TaxID=3273426 RepID=UPI003611A5D6
MNLLHICSYYSGSKLYSNLIKELANSNIKQDVFVPIKDKNQIGRNELAKDQYENISFHYANILLKSDRLFFNKKINKQFQWVENQILSKKNINFIHAHTVFSDGGTAYELHKKYGIDYIVNVRNTDINYFYKYRMHLRPLMYEILLHAKQIVFISHAYMKKVISILPKQILEKTKIKFKVIPNGIDNYWHENPSLPKSLDSEDIKLLFIGRMDKNKNVKAIISALNHLSKDGHRCTLDMIGTGPLEKKMKSYSKKLGLGKNVTFHGHINERESILSIMDDSHVFVMPSYTETFGLVYIEAMSRGIPIIYTSGEGVDGFFEVGEVGYPILPNDKEDMIRKIFKIKENYKVTSSNCIKNSKKFDWKEISMNYLKCYNL